MTLPAPERHSIRVARGASPRDRGWLVPVAKSVTASTAPSASPLLAAATVTRHRVLIADDHRIFLEGLERLLEPRFDVVARAANGAELVELAGAVDHDLIVTDYSMPELTGVEAVRVLRGAGVRTPVVMLTLHEEPAYAREALLAGVDAYVAKSEASSDLLMAMDAALSGDTWLSPSLAALDPDGDAADRDQEAAAGEPTLDEVSSRQRQIAGSIARGRTARQIAEALGLSRKTVEYHKYKLMRDLGLESSADLIRFAVEHGLDRDD